MTHDAPRKTFKALGALLTYPDAELVAALESLEACLVAEALLPAPALAPVSALCQTLRQSELLEAQETYITLFDRTRSLALHLYEHVHGESRERGPAMVNLADLYRRHGFAMTTAELPDFLPLLCEFLSQIPHSAARAILADAALVLATLRRRLEQRQSPYAGVLSALVTLAETAVDEAEVVKALAEVPDEDPDDLEALDRVWAETEVQFGAGSALAGSGFAGAGAPAAGRAAAGDDGGCPLLATPLAALAAARSGGTAATVAPAAVPVVS